MKDISSQEKRKRQDDSERDDHKIFGSRKLSRVAVTEYRQGGGSWKLDVVRRKSNQGTDSHRGTPEKPELGGTRYRWRRGREKVLETGRSLCRGEADAILSSPVVRPATHSQDTGDLVSKEAKPENKKTTTQTGLSRRPTESREGSWKSKHWVIKLPAPTGATVRQKPPESKVKPSFLRTEQKILTFGVFPIQRKQAPHQSLSSGAPYGLRTSQTCTHDKLPFSLWGPLPCMDQHVFRRSLQREKKILT